MTEFVIRGLSPEPWAELFGLPNAKLAYHGAVRMRADAQPGYPCRATLRDVEVGETLLLVNYEHQTARTPYRSRNAIFISEGATQAASFANEVPPSLSARLISLRAFNAAGMMADGQCVPGGGLAEAIGRMFTIGDVAYLHAHNAGRGCFAARIDRT